MSRRHALCKVVALVQGANIVRRGSGVPVALCFTADARCTLTKMG
jgi:hypothetical protein